MASVWVHNALFFGAVLVVLFTFAFLLSRYTGRVLGYGLYAAEQSDRAALQTALNKKSSQVIVLLTTLLSLGLIVAASLLSFYQIDATPSVWAWFEATFLVDRAALTWLLGQLLLLVILVVYVRRALRFLVGLVVTRAKRKQALLEHHKELDVLFVRLDALLAWGMLFAVLSAAGFVLGMPAAFNDPLLIVTCVVIGVLAARALAILADLTVDVGVQLVRALEDKPNALRYLGRLGRLDHIARITKRTLEYFVFIGVATFVLHQISQDTALARSGLVVIRLIALIYIGRVAVEVFSLALREVLLSEPEKRTEAENQQRLTLVPIATSIIRYVVYFCMTIMALEEVGIDTSPILAGAGLLGLAVGLGAQTFVGDVVSGFFILFEGMFLVGDRVTVGDVVGNVEEIGVRVLKVRDEYGVLHCVPNGEVRSVANHARLFVNAVVDFGIPYDEDIPAVIAHLKEHFEAVRPQHDDILADPEFAVQDLLESAVLIRALVRVKPGRDDAVAEVVRTEVLAALTALEVAPQACQIIKVHPGPKGGRQALISPRRLGATGPSEPEPRPT